MKDNSVYKDKSLFLFVITIWIWCNVIIAPFAVLILVYLHDITAAIFMLFLGLFGLIEIFEIRMRAQRRKDNQTPTEKITSDKLQALNCDTKSILIRIKELLKR